MNAPLGPRPRVPYPRILAVLLAYALGAAQFLATMSLLLDVIHVAGGMVAFGALMGLVALGIVALSFVIAIPAYYADGERRRTFLPRVLTVTGIQGFLFTALHGFHYVVNRAVVPGAMEFAVGGAGLAVGIACSVLAGNLFARARRIRHAPRADGGRVAPGEGALR